MEPGSKRYKRDQSIESNFHSAGLDDDEQSEQLSEHSNFDSEAETVASVKDPPEDEYELLDLWVLGPPGLLRFVMKLNIEDKIALMDWCLESESWFVSGFILDSEPLLFRALRDEERWGF